MLKDLRHELAAEVNGQQNFFVQLDVHPHTLFLCECGSVEVWVWGCGEYGCDSVGKCRCECGCGEV